MKLKMYFLMLALGVCGAAMQSCDDDDDNLKVPEKLQSAFSQKYPEASPKWKTRGNYYIADFQDQNYESEAWFTFDAVWLMTETDLPYAALPEAVKNAFQNSEYRSWRPDDVDMIERESMEPVYVLEVQQINRAAMKLMNIQRESDVMGEPIVRILDPKPFMDVQRTGKTLRDSKAYLAEYDKYVEQTIVFDKEYKALICIMRDVTEEEEQKQKKEDLSRQTVETADRVVDKQMRIVQEIASLLGETAAETKIALTKLKESMTDE